MNADEVEKLKQTLGELHAELDQLDAANDDVRALLATAIADIQGVLKRQPGQPPTPGEESPAKRLTAAARHFEETHPQLAGLLGSVIDALSRMGI